jgi:hypothetical protein
LEVAEQHGLSGVLEFFSLSGPDVLRSVLKGLTVDEVTTENLWPFSSRGILFSDLEKPSGHTLDIIPRAWVPLANDYIAQWSPTDNRSLWLVGILILLACPERALDRRLEAGVRTIALAMAPARAATTFRESDAAYDADEATHTSYETLAGADPVEAAHSPDEFAHTALPTEHAGFFFCLGILERFGMSLVLARHPELMDHGFTRILLRQLSAAAVIAKGDSASELARWFAAEHADEGDAALRFSDTMLPEQWRTRPSILRAWTVSKLALVWVLAIRRWVRRATGMTLQQMASRPGRIHLTPSHMEIVMPQSAIDIRIRKAGIDVNPGWLLWLCKVVSFRYLCEVMELLPPSVRPRPIQGGRRLQRGRI